MKILIFALNNIYLGIPFTNINFIENKNRINIERISALSGYITGIADYRNIIFPIYNLPLRLGLKEQQTGYMTVISTDKLALGIEIGLDTKIADVKKSEIFLLPVLVRNRSGCFENIILLKNKKFVYIIDVKKLVSQKEQQEICQLVKGR